jgi:hypothetical protein
VHGEVLGEPHHPTAADVDRAAEGDDARDALAAPVRGDLVAEHPALRVAAEMDVAARGVPDAVDRVADGEDVVGERPRETARLLLR